MPRPKREITDESVLRMAYEQMADQNSIPESVKAAKLGAIVGYVLTDGITRPAIIVQVWESSAQLVNLQVFTDSRNDNVSVSMIHKSCVKYGKEINNWYWLD